MQFIRVLFIVVLAASCSDSDLSYEDQIRLRIQHGKTLVEERKASEIIEQVTDDFKASQNINRDNLRPFLFRLFLVYKTPHVFLRIKSINVENEKGHASIVAMLSNQPLDLKSIKEHKFNKIRVRVLAMELLLRVQNDEWLLEKVDWREATVKDLF